MGRADRLIAFPAAALVVLACSLAGGPTPGQGEVLEVATDESPVPDSFSLVILHPAQGDLTALLSAHAEIAAGLGRRPFVEFSADWCPSCVALAGSLQDERMVDAFQGTYIIRLDFDEWKSRLGGAGFVVLGVPTFFELDQEGGLTGRAFTGAAWGADVPENMAPILKEFFQGATGS